MKTLWKLLVCFMLCLVTCGCEWCDDQEEKYQKWPEGIIPYYIDDSNFSEETLENISKGVEEINSKTKIKFILFTKDDIKYRNNFCLIQCTEEITGAANADIGMKRKNIVYLPKVCDIDIILHELTHVIGMTHIHQRNDRDKYVEVFFDNILDEKKYTFYKKKNPFVDYTKFNYDFNSIQHYSKYTWSIDWGNKPTIIKKGEPDYVLGGFHLTNTDIEVINTIYE